MTLVYIKYCHALRAMFINIERADICCKGHWDDNATGISACIVGEWAANCVNEVTGPTLASIPTLLL